MVNLQSPPLASGSSPIINLPPSGVAPQAGGLIGARMHYINYLGCHAFETVIKHDPNVNGILYDVMAGNVLYRGYMANMVDYQYPQPYIDTGAPQPLMRRTSSGWTWEWEDIHSFRDKWMPKEGDPGTAGGKVYYVAADGLTANPGTRALPKLAGRDAWNQADCISIRVIQGGSNIVDMGGTAPRGMSFICDDGIIFNRLPQANAFVDQTGGVWRLGSGAGTLAYGVPYRNELDEYGLPRAWGPRVDTLAEVATTPNSWFLDYTSGSRAVYVQSHTQPIINSTILVTYAGTWNGSLFATVHANADKVLYIENAIIAGPAYALSNSGGTLVMRNCKTVGGVNVNLDAAPYITNGVRIVRSQCVAGYSRADTIASSNATWELSHRNLAVNYHGDETGSLSHQGGGTVHDQTTILRIGERVSPTSNSTFVDVSTGASQPVSLMLDCKIHPSRLKPISHYKVTGDRHGYVVDGDYAPSGSGAVDCQSTNPLWVDGALDGLTILNASNPIKIGT